MSWRFSYFLNINGKNVILFLDIEIWYQTWNWYGSASIQWIAMYFHLNIRICSLSIALILWYNNWFFHQIYYWLLPHNNKDRKMEPLQIVHENNKPKKFYSIYWAFCFLWVTIVTSSRCWRIDFFCLAWLDSESFPEYYT